MPAASARAIVASRSRISTRPASIAMAVAPPAAAASSDSRPTAGTSKRKSWAPATAFTTTAPGPLSAVPRRMASVVPSIASTAATAPRRTTTVWPTLASATARATVRPRRMSLHSASVGARDVQVRAPGSQSPRNGRWSRSSIPSPASVVSMACVMLPSTSVPARATMSARAPSGARDAPSRSPIQNLPEKSTPVTVSRARASITGPIASMRVGTVTSASPPSAAAPGNANATTRHPCRRASDAIRAGSAPAPHINPRDGIGTLAVRLVPRDLGDPVADHPLDLEGHGQGAQVVLVRGRHRLARLAPADGAQQVLELQLERVVAVNLEVLDEGGAPVADGAAGHRVLLGGPLVDVDVLLGVVQHDVGVGLRDGQRADLLLGGAAGGDGGERPRLEPDLNAGNVGHVRVHGGAARGELTRGRAHEGKHDVDVVDHEVHDHGVLLHAGYEGTQAPRLDEDGRVHDLPELVHGAVEPLHMTHVQDRPRAGGDGEELARLVHGGRHGLFDEHADARLQEVACDVEVLLRRHRHAGDVHAPDHVAVVAERHCLVLRGD